MLREEIVYTDDIFDVPVSNGWIRTQLLKRLKNYDGITIPNDFVVCDIETDTRYRFYYKDGVFYNIYNEIFWELPKNILDELNKYKKEDDYMENNLLRRVEAWRIKRIDKEINELIHKYYRTVMTKEEEYTGIRPTEWVNGGSFENYGIIEYALIMDLCKVKAELLEIDKAETLEEIDYIYNREGLSDEAKSLCIALLNPDKDYNYYLDIACKIFKTGLLNIENNTCKFTPIEKTEYKTKNKIVYTIKPIKDSYKDSRVIIELYRNDKVVSWFTFNELDLWHIK